MRWYKSVQLLLCLFFVLPALAQAPMTVMGRVLDEWGEAVPGARVSVSPGAYRAVADGAGEYRILLPVGEYILTASHVGYIEAQHKIDLKEARRLDFVLREYAHKLATVQVESATERDRMRRRAYSAQSIDVRSAAGSTGSLSLLVKRAAGINIRETGGIGSDFNLSINGLSGNAVRYFVDGVPLSAYGSGASLANLPLAMLERVDMYKGVVPPELGEDALGGAINIVTKRSQSSYADVSVSAGSFHTYRGDLNAQYIMPRSGLTLRGTLGAVLSQNDYIMRDVEIWDKEKGEYVRRDFRRFHDGYKSYLGKVEVGVMKRPWADELFVGMTAHTEDKEIQTGLRQDIVVGQAKREGYSLGFFARYRKHSIASLPLTLNLYASHTIDHSMLVDTTFRTYSWDGSWAPFHFSEVRGRDRTIRHYHRPNRMVRANIQYTIDSRQSLNFNYLFTGSDNRIHDDYDTEFVSTNDYMSKHIFGLSYNAHLWDDRLNLILFLKDYVFHSALKQTDLPWLTGIRNVKPIATRNNIGYGAGARYAFSDLLAAKVSYEHSYRLPVAREFLGNGETILPNFALRPESSHNINIGLYGTWSPSPGHTVGYEATAFARKVEDYILRLSLNEREGQYSNVTAATVLGGEGEVQYDYNDLFRSLLNVTFIDERNKSKTLPNGRPNVTYGNRMPNRPWFYANWEQSLVGRNPFGLRDRTLRVSLTTRYVHWFYLTWEAFGTKASKVSIPSQLSNDLSVTWGWCKERYTLSLECNNIFDQKLYDNYMLQKPGRALFCKFRAFIH